MRWLLQEIGIEKAAEYAGMARSTLYDLLKKSDELFFRKRCA
ncbi:MAG: hypothetical protein ACLR8L_00275 [Oscillospiraceae bacterium]